MQLDGTFHTKIVGVTFKNDDGTDRQRIIRTLLRNGELEEGTELRFVPQPTNPYDSNCILVQAKNGQTLGCLSREIAAQVVPQIKQGYTFKVYVSSQTGGDIGYSYGINIRVERYKKSARIDDTDRISAIKSSYTQYNAEQDYESGKRYYERGDFDSAVSLLKKAATAGNRDAIYLLAICYDYGRGVIEDKRKAFSLYLEAAEKGQVDAQGDLSISYYQGSGTEQNYEKALFWAHKAANQGSSYGMFTIGKMYEVGNGVPQNSVESYKWYLKAAELGHINAAHNVATALLLGNGVSKNASEAAKWNRIAAEGGNETAQFNLAFQYFQGDGVPRDMAEGQYWIKEAARNGHQRAIAILSQYGLL